MNKILLPLLLILAGQLSAAPAPDFNVIDSDGNDHTLYGDYITQGKLIVLEVFFVNCPPCATHAPYLQNLYQAKKTQHPGKLEFLLLTNKANDHNAQVAQYKIAKGLTMPAVSADGGSLQALQPYESGLFGDFFGTPTFIVIAPGSGEVFFDIRGSNAQETIAMLGELIDQLLVPASPSNICPSQTATGIPVDSVRYTVDAANWDTTFWAGNYTLSKFPALKNPLIPYTVSAYRNDHHNAGVSTFDLVLMSKHILGIEPFTEDWKTIAADVNGSGTVTTFDIVETRKLILGIYNVFPSSDSWRFSPATSTPLVNGYCFTFQCVKIGDVNGSFAGFGQPDVEERDDAPALARATDRLFGAGEIGQLDLRADAPSTWLGLQMTLAFDPSVIEVLGLASPALPGFDAQAYNLARQPEGLVPVSWVAGALPATLKPDEIWLTVRFRALRPQCLSEAFQLPSAPLRAEAYAGNGGKQAIELFWEPKPVPGSITITPNPASGGTFALTLDAATPGEQLVQLIDNHGRIVFSQSYLLQKGTNRIDFQLQNAGPGLYCLTLDGVVAGKVLVP